MTSKTLEAIAKREAAKKPQPVTIEKPKRTSKATAEPTDTPGDAPA